MLITDTDKSLGRVVRPGDADWDAARGAFNLLIDQRPEAIAFPANEREVAAVVAHASERGLRVAPQATGHNPGPLGSLEGTLILNTSALTGVSIDASRAARARRRGDEVGAGHAAPVRARPGGVCTAPRPTWASSATRSAAASAGSRASTACRPTPSPRSSSSPPRATSCAPTPVHEPELFWALRGGGGNFGVVTAIEFSVLPLRELYAGALFYPLEQAADVLHEWWELLPSLPEEITSWANVLHFPPLPEIPDAVRGQSFAVVMAAFLGSEADGRELLRPLRELGPTLDTFAIQPPVGLSELAMDPPRPAALPHAARARRRADGRRRRGDRPYRRPGLVADDDPAPPHGRRSGAATAADAGARATLPGEVCVLGLGVVPEPAADPVVRADLDALMGALAPRRVGDYPNFVEEPADAERLLRRRPPGSGCGA